MKISFTHLNSKVKLSVFLLLAIAGISQHSFSQTVTWNFGVGSGSLSPSSGTPITNLTVSNFTQGNTFGTITPLTNAAPVSSGYTGASGNYYYGQSARSGALQTGAGFSAYYEFTITPANGFSVVLNSISFGSVSSGPTNYALRSSLNSYSSNITAGILTSSWGLKSATGLNVSSATNTAVTFRIYGYGGSSGTGNSINWKIDDVSISVSLVNTADYRTKSAGNFSSAGIWQYNSSGSTWVNATLAPTTKNNVTIYHAVALDQSFSVSKNFTIGTNGSLVINATRVLDVAAGATAAFGGNAVTIKSNASGSGSIGKMLGTLTGATNVTVERYIPANSSRAWRLLAVPTTGAQTIYQAWQENGSALTSNGFGTQLTKPGTTKAANGYDTTSASASILNSYNVVSNTWSNTISDTRATAIQSTGGYFVFVRGDRGKGVTGGNGDVNATTLRTSGTLKQGSIASGTIGAGTYVPLGNPYASAIAFDQLTRTGGVDATFYLWDAKLIQGASLGSYQTFSATNGYVPTPGGGSYSGSNTTIESGQAFFVHATSTSGTVTFTEASKVASTTNRGLRAAQPGSQLVKLTTKLFGASNDIVLDGNDVVFDSQYDNTVNSNDAFKMKNPIENIGIVRDNQLLAVEARKPVADKDEINFGLSNLKQQTYKLQITPQNLSSEGLTAVLYDSYKKTTTTLNLSDKNELEFTVDANAASSATDRFKVVFRISNTTPVAVTKPGIKVYPNPVEGSVMNIQFAGKPAGTYKLRLLNNAGQVVMSNNIQHAGGTLSNHAVTLPAGVKGGAYQVEIVSPQKSRSVQKVLVNQ